VCLKSLQPLSREFGIFRMNENDRIQIKLHFFFNYKDVYREPAIQVVQPQII
jgi:hypothetical protein